MSERGLDKDPRRRRRWGGRGRGSPPPAREAPKTEVKFKGGNPDLPCLNYGASLKEKRPIEFLQLVGEHCTITYKSCIAQAFWTSPPTFGIEEEEPILPETIPNSNAGKAMLADFRNDKMEWKTEKKKIEEHKRVVWTTLVYAQLSDSSHDNRRFHYILRRPLPHLRRTGHSCVSTGVKNIARENHHNYVRYSNPDTPRLQSSDFGRH